MMSEKKCSKCGGLKPAAQFYRDASSATGLDSCCRDCRRAYARSRPKRDFPSVESKICSHCCKVKPACEFGKNARESTGLQPWCRACHSAYVNNKPKVDAPVVSEKRCSKCGLVKRAEDFCKDKYKPSGLRSWCRQCRNVARAATRNESPRVQTQKCRGCGEVKPACDFPKCKENASGLKSLCRMCRSGGGESVHDESRRAETAGGNQTRSAGKRKASEVDFVCGGLGGQKLKTSVPGDSCESRNRRTGTGSVESPFSFSVPTRRRSPRKSGGPTGNSPTSQWNNGVWSQDGELLNGAWVAKEWVAVGSQSGLVQNSQLPETAFSPSPLTMALEDFKIEPSSESISPSICSPSSVPGIWLDLFDGHVQRPVFLPRTIDLPVGASSVLPCVQVVLTAGGEEVQNCSEAVCVSHSLSQQNRCGLQVLAEAAELVTSSPVGGEVSNQ